MLLKLNLVVDLESPVRAYLCNHICQYGTALTWSGPVLFHRYLQIGRVMCECYLDQVGGDNHVSPVECLARESPFGTVVWPRRW